jgi:MFS transporter, AAHS family, 4-hydroxybenzoate transporter
MGGTVEIDRFIDKIKVGRFMVGVWLLCAAVLCLDGYDLTVISFMAPELVKEFGFEESALGFVFSASLVGVAVGGPFGGWIGDRYGRRPTIIGSCALFGAATLAMLMTTTIEMLALSRFVVGLGLGGAMASALAIAAEFTPRRLRHRVVALIATAVPLGAVIPGVLTATLVPDYGWRLLAFVGGGVPLLIAAVLICCMPESMKYLALRQHCHARLAALLKRIDPNLQADFSIGDGPKGAGGRASPLMLFGNGLAATTGLMWVLFFVNAMTLYLVISWLPLVLQNLGMSTQQAGQVSALFSAAGLLGGLAVAALISWAGVALLPALFVVSVPFLVMFAAFDLSPTAIVLCVLIPGMSAGAIQVAGNTVAGAMYPTEVRASGVGWALAVGRAGAICGPIVGAAVYALWLPPQQMFAFASVPMIVGVIAGLGFAVVCRQRFGSLHVDDTSQVPRTGGPRSRSGRAGPVPIPQFEASKQVEGGME